MSQPSSVTCPKCPNGAVPAYKHCNSLTCDLFRCARCRAYGPYKNLRAEAWRDFSSTLPLELLYEMASLEEDQYDPPRPAPWAPPASV
jgi:hypothetical protein